MPSFAHFTDVNGARSDDNARDRAVALARRKYPAANLAAEPVTIYELGETSSQEALHADAERP